jgi:hypothetical protein
VNTVKRKDYTASWIASSVGLAFVIVGLTGRQIVSEPAAAWAALSPPVVALSGERIMQSSLAAADFNEDGDKEIVVGGKDGMLYVIAYDGISWSVVWSRQTGDDLQAAGAPSVSECGTSQSDIRSAPAIADLDNDGHLEIVVTTGGDPASHRNGGVLVYRHSSPWSFSVVPEWPQPRIDELGLGDGSRQPDGCWDGIWGSPAVGDIDGDGDLEVVVIGLNRRIHAWNHDGVPVSGWPIYRDNDDRLLRGGWSSPAMGDIDGDGLWEVVVGTNSPPWESGQTPDYSKATVWAINGDSSNVPGWPVTTENNVQSSPVLGDIDGDGRLEVVVGSGVTVEGGDGRRVYAWNDDGSTASGWPKSTGGDMYAPPALGDLDGDGDLEVIIGCGTENEASPPPCTSLYVWDGDGSPLPGFPVSPPGNGTVSSDPNGLPYTPVLADYDGDGTVEILVVNRWSWGISTVDGDGTPHNDVSLQSQSGFSSPPLVDDLDNDGQLEIANGGAYNNGSNGGVYIWDVAGGEGAALPWPMFQHDVQRTGNAYFGDATPPQNPIVTSPTHTPVTWSNDATVQVDWSGASDTGSGIGGYYYTWDKSPTTSVDRNASRLDANVVTLASSLDDGTDWYFHIRAVDRAGLLAENTVHFGPLQIDTVPPVSQASTPTCAVLSAAISWSGTDTGSGIVSYDVQVRQGSTGSWTNWKSGTTDTLGVYAGDTGHTYYFRSRARDAAGNLEPAPASPDTQTLLTQYGFSGVVRNGRAQPVFHALLEAAPAAPLATRTDMDGRYLLCYETAGTHTLTASRSGFGSLPAMQHLLGTAQDLDFYLPPPDDGLVNGQFESGDLSGWSVSGSGGIIVTDTAHTGYHAVQLGDGGGPGSWSATLSQAAVISEGLEDPTLSLVYHLEGNSTLLLSKPAWVAAQGLTRTLTYTLPSATTWSHTWMDLGSLQGQSVTVTLHLDSPAGGSGWLIVDEITLGTAVPGVRRVHLPVLLRQYGS